MSKEIKNILVSKTTPKGIITYCNQEFINISGYSEKELLGQPHSIVRHPDMPRAVFKYLWTKIQNREECNAFVKNLSKSGDSYWVFANVTPSFDISSKIVGYYSVRRAPNPDALAGIQAFYQELKDIESAGGLKASLEHFTKHFENLGVKYEDFVIKMQLGAPIECEGANCFDTCSV